MRTSLRRVAVLALGLATPLGAQTSLDLAAAARGSNGWSTTNRRAALVDSGGRTFLRLDEAPNGGMTATRAVTVANGEIELDLRGRDVFQKSFIGVAFHITSEVAFDLVYLRPFNYRSADSVRHAHAIQYASYPEFPWEKLRADHPGAYEAPVAGDADPAAWHHLRIAFRGRDLAVYLDRSATPALHVQMLGDRTDGGVGLWVGDLSPGDFANVVIRRDGGLTSGDAGKSQNSGPALLHRRLHRTHR